MVRRSYSSIQVCQIQCAISSVWHTGCYGLVRGEIWTFFQHFLKRRKGKICARDMRRYDIFLFKYFKIEDFEFVIIEQFWAVLFFFYFFWEGCGSCSYAWFEFQSHILGLSPCSCRYSTASSLISSSLSSPYSPGKALVTSLQPWWWWRWSSPFRKGWSWLRDCGCSHGVPQWPER